MPGTPKEIEIILTRHLASCLAMPICISDPRGTVIYYNEPAELILGRRFDEAGEFPARELLATMEPCDEQGQPLGLEQLQATSMLLQRRPFHHQFWLHGPGEGRRRIEV